MKNKLSIEERLERLEAENQRLKTAIERLNDVNEIQKVMSKYSFLLSACLGLPPMTVPDLNSLL